MCLSIFSWKYPYSKQVKCHSTHRFLHRLGGCTQIIISIQKERSGSSAPLFLVRVMGDAEPVQAASDRPFSAFSVQLAPREAGISCPVTRTKKRGVVHPLLSFWYG